MDISTWLAFVAASTALLLIPGPTVLLVLSYALSQGRKVALATAGGVALGDLIAMSASLAGLGALVLTSAQLFIALKWIGAAYLIYLGVQLLRNAGNASIGQDTPRVLSARECFVNATAVTALNPKSIVFFIAFVPQFVDPAAALLPQFAILIATFVTLASVNALAYAVLADVMRARIARPSAIAWLTRAGGATLIAMGVATAAVRRTA
ncbi:threonine/homoserine/homoserine lactone efflux protein [Litoreibacter ponti]|uniref:Threonine/homoserine/homoserine lactone efflux protein n=1 Tax=Litoreibacter ponti TaxID=1510457 RepID=A0A2T6BFA1_9RHOB|nr:LysE family translocator [Litoreibacter ponti]PTX54743.1 threonine/homoserine/homoserine lactone efflux protein [Litoreibacter ponti]